MMYKFVSKIKEGSFGEVYLAVQRDTGKEVAVKKTKHTVSVDQRFMIRREFEIMRILKHPNILVAVEFYRANDSTHLVLEYADGAQDFNGYKVDTWATGVTLYLTVMGYFPFDQDVDRESFLAGRFAQPRHATAMCRRLLKKTLVKDPQERINLNELLNSDVWLNTPIRPVEVNTWLEKPKSMVQRKINARTQTLTQHIKADEQPSSPPKRKASLSDRSHPAESLILFSSTAESKSAHLNTIQRARHEDVTISKPTACEGNIKVRKQTVLHSNRAKIHPNAPRAIVSKKKDVRMSKPGVRNHTDAKPRVPHAVVSERQDVRTSKPVVKNQTDAKRQMPHALVSKKQEVRKSKPVVKNQTDAKRQMPHAMVSTTKAVRKVRPIARHQDTAKPTAKPKHLAEFSSTAPQQDMVSKKKDQGKSKPMVQHRINAKPQLAVIRENLTAVPPIVKHVPMKKDLRKVPPVMQNRVYPKPQVMIRKNVVTVPATVKNAIGGVKNDTKEVQPVAKNRVNAKLNVVCRKNLVEVPPTAPQGLVARKKDFSASKPLVQNQINHAKPKVITISKNLVTVPQTVTRAVFSLEKDAGKRPVFPVRFLKNVKEEK